MPTLPQESIDLLKFIFGKDTSRCWLGTDASRFGGWARGMEPRMKPNRTHYYVISTLRDTAYTRSNAFFEAGYVIILDDVGTKLDLDQTRMFAPAPTYVVETSPGNFQFAYVLETPESDPRKFQAMLDGIKHSNVWSGGGDGTGLVRYVRLPSGVNFKNGFQTRLVSFSKIKHRIDDLAKAFNIDVSPGVIAARKSPTSLTAAPATEDLKRDPVFQFLEDESLLANANAPVSVQGWVPLSECPWGESHTAGRRDGAAYHSTLGAFKCHHAHCAEKHMGEFRTWLWSHEKYRAMVFPSPEKSLAASVDSDAASNSNKEDTMSNSATTPSNTNASVYVEPTQQELDALKKTLGLTDTEIATMSGGMMEQHLNKIIADTTQTYFPVKAIGGLPNQQLRVPNPFVTDGYVDIYSEHLHGPQSAPKIMSSFLRRASVSLMVSSPGTGKSSYTLAMGVALQHTMASIVGEKKFSRFAGGAMILNCEDTAADVSLRLEAIYKKYNLDVKNKAYPLDLWSPKEPIHLFEARKSANTGSAVVASRLFLLKARLYSYFLAFGCYPALIVIDTLAAVMRGLNENDNGVMAQIYGLLNHLAEITQSSILILHHTSKHSDALIRAGGDTGVYAARGAGSVTGSVRAQVLLRHLTDKERKHFGWKPEDADRTVVLQVTKANYLPPADRTHYFRHETVPVPTIDHMGDLDSLAMNVLVPLPVQAMKVNLTQTGSAPHVDIPEGYEDADIDATALTGLARIAAALQEGSVVTLNQTRGRSDWIGAHLGLGQEVAYALAGQLIKGGYLRRTPVKPTRTNSNQRPYIALEMTPRGRAKVKAALAKALPSMDTDPIF